MTWSQFQTCAKNYRKRYIGHTVFDYGCVEGDNS